MPDDPVIIDPAIAAFNDKTWAALTPDERTAALHAVAGRSDDEAKADFHAERLDVLLSLDWQAMNAFRNKYGLGGPRKPADKVLLMLHKERMGCPDLTDEERQASADWIEARTNRGKRA